MPRSGMPMSATLARSAFASMISCARRLRQRSMAALSRTSAAPGEGGAGAVGSVMLPWRPLGAALKGAKGRCVSASVVPLLPLLAPGAAVFHDPVEERLFKADIVTGFFTLDPLVAEDFL